MPDDKRVPDVEIFNPAEVEKIDQNANGYTYFGKAVPGTLTSAATWQIQRMGVVGAVTTYDWADGDSEFNNVWDNRTALIYS